jgi:hypothetical protein
MTDVQFTGADEQSANIPGEKVGGLTKLMFRLGAKSQKQANSILILIFIFLISLAAYTAFGFQKDKSEKESHIDPRLTQNRNENI